MLASLLFSLSESAPPVEPPPEPEVVLRGLILWGKPVGRFAIDRPNRQDDDDDFMGGLF